MGCLSWQQEATELSAHFARVESVFADGDLQRIASTLSSIRQGLALVGDVPEFKGGGARLQVKNALCVASDISGVGLSSFYQSLPDPKGRCSMLHGCPSWQTIS